MDFIIVKIELLNGSLIEGHFVDTDDKKGIDMAMFFLADYIDSYENPTGIKSYEVIDPVFGVMLSYGLGRTGIVDQVLSGQLSI